MAESVEEVKIRVMKRKERDREDGKEKKGGRNDPKGNQTYPSAELCRLRGGKSRAGSEDSPEVGQETDRYSACEQVKDKQQQNPESGVRMLRQWGPG
jgi:hypothetical protein